MPLVKSSCSRENCTCETFIDTTSATVDILIVGGTPGVDDVKTGKPFSGKRGIVLRNCLEHLSTKYNISYAIVNTVRKRGKGTEYCLNQLQKEIKALNPKIVVALGKTTYTVFNPVQHYPDTFLLEEGCVRNVKTKWYEGPLIASIHPKWCFENDPCSAGFLYEALHKAILFTQGISFNISNEFEYKIIETVDELEEILNKMRNSKKKVGVDTETTSLNRVYEQTVLSIQFCNDGKIGYVLPYNHFDSPFSKKEMKRIKKLLKDFFTMDTKVTGYIFQNAKFDMHQIFRELHVLIYNAPIIDTMFNEFLLEENWSRVAGHFGKSGPYSLNTLSYKRGFTCYITEQEMSKDKRANLKDVPIKDFARYAAADAIVVWNIWKSQLKYAKHCNYELQFKKMALIYNTHLTRVLVYMEHCGIPINIDILRDMCNPRTSQLIKVINEVSSSFNDSENVKKVETILMKQQTGSTTSLFGKPILFNINKKLHQELLFTKILNLEPLTESGKTSIDAAFQKAYSDVPEVKLVTQWNKLQKLKTSYIDNIMSFMDKKTGQPDFYTDLRIRAQYMFDAVTGRLRSRGPNCQQRPSHGENINFVLSMFESTKDKLIVKLDQSTFEVRGLAFLTKDTALCKSFIEMNELKTKWRKDPSIMTKDELKNLTDSHKRNASIFFNTPIDKVTKDQRQDAKGFVFGCFTEDTIVSTENGPIRIGLLSKLDKEIKVITQNGTFTSEGSEFMGVKPIVSVMTDKAHLKGTSGHWVMTVTNYKLEMKPLGSLKVGDTVLYQKGVFGNTIPKIENEELSLSETEGIGSLIFFDEILSSKKEYVSAYLRGVFKHAKFEEHQISLTSFDPDLLFNICYLLNLFDIDSSVVENNIFELIIPEQSIPMYEKEILGLNPLKEVKKIEYINLEALISNSSIENEKFFPYKNEKLFLKEILLKHLPKKIDILELPKYKEVFEILNLKNEYETLILLSKETIKVSKIIRGPIDFGIKKVYDVINVERFHTWSANGVIVHNTMYGMSDNSIANNLGKDIKEAKKIKDLFFKNMPQASKWLFDYVIKFARTNLYVESPLGRKRRVWGYLLNNKQVTSKMDRLSMNSTIQGVCSDLNIIATSLLIDKVYKLGMGKYQVPDNEAFMITNLVHDSCEMEVPKQFFKMIYKVERMFTDEIVEYVKDNFDFSIDIPLEVDMEIGKKLSDMNKWDGSKINLKLIKEKMSVL